MLPGPLLSLSENDQPTLVWWIILGLIALGPALHSWIKVYDWLKGKNIDTSQFVTKVELAAVRSERDQELSRTVKTIESKIKNLDETLRDLNRELPTIHRILGQLEGHDHLLFSKIPKGPKQD
jgi:uncharacterized protein HemX